MCYNGSTVRQRRSLNMINYSQFNKVEIEQLCRLKEKAVQSNLNLEEIDNENELNNCFQNTIDLHALYYASHIINQIESFICDKLSSVYETGPLLTVLNQMADYVERIGYEQIRIPLCSILVKETSDDIISILGDNDLTWLLKNYYKKVEERS